MVRMLRRLWGGDGNGKSFFFRWEKKTQIGSQKRVRGWSRWARLLCGLDDADGDLAAISDEEGLEFLHLPCPSVYLTPAGEADTNTNHEIFA